MLNHAVMSLLLYLSWGQPFTFIVSACAACHHCNSSDLCSSFARNNLHALHPFLCDWHLTPSSSEKAMTSTGLANSWLMAPGVSKSPIDTLSAMTLSTSTVDSTPAFTALCTAAMHSVSKACLYAPCTFSVPGETGMGEGGWGRGCSAAPHWGSWLFVSLPPAVKHLCVRSRLEAQCDKVQQVCGVFYSAMQCDSSEIHVNELCV